MPVQCIGCRILGRKAAPPAMAKLGFAICAYQEKDPGRYVPLLYVHECDKFEACQPEVERARRDWLKKNMPGGPA